MPTEFPTGTRVNSAVIGEITDQLESFSDMDQLGQRPLTSAAGSLTSLITLTYDYKNGYAYEISWQARVQLNGLATTAIGAAEISIRRSNASGTVVINPGYTAVPGLNNFTCINGFTIVKVTGGDTTQTLSMCVQFSSINGATSIDIEAGTTAPTIFAIKCIGLATDHPEAMELPKA